MKKIIDGKKYDTETAKKIGVNKWFDDSVSYTQRETFFQKRTGEFFRFDEKKTTWGNIYEYDKLVPISTYEAKSILEKCLTIAEYEAIFGEVAE